MTPNEISSILVRRDLGEDALRKRLVGVTLTRRDIAALLPTVQRRRYGRTNREENQCAREELAYRKQHGFTGTGWGARQFI